MFLDKILIRILINLFVTKMLTPKVAQDVRVLLLDPLPVTAKNHFDGASYAIEECFENLSEAQLLKKISEVHIVCLS